MTGTIPGHKARVAIGTVAFLAVAAAPDRPLCAQTCIDYESHLQWVTSLPADSRARDLIVAGGYAYVVAGLAGLQVFDLAAPRAPVRVAGFALEDCQDVVVAGGFAFAADRFADLVVLDVSNPRAPSWASALSVRGFPQGIAVAGGYAYLACGADGLQIVDIANPRAPRRVGQVVSSVWLRDLCVAGTRLYGAARYDGLLVFDLGDPANPRLAATFDTPGQTYDVAVAGSLAYLADIDGLQVVDVADPGSLHLVGAVDTPGAAQGVAITGAHALLACGQPGLQVIDITNPAAPRITGKLSTRYEAYGVAVHSGLAYVAASDLVVVDVNTGRSPELAGAPIPGRAEDLALLGDHAFVAAHDAGLQVVDISNPSAPQHVGGLDTPGDVVDVAVSTGYAFVIDGWLRVIDVADPTSPQLAASVYFGDTRGVAVAGSYAYVVGVGAQDDDFRVFDISNPRAPQPLGYLDMPAPAAVEISVHHAFIFQGPYLTAIDVANPNQLQYAGYITMPDPILGIALVPGSAYVTHGQFLSIVDVSDPLAMRVRGTVRVADVAAVRVAVQGPFAYVTCYDYGMGLRVVDVSNADAPRLLGGVESPGAVGIVARGTIFFADAQRGLQVAAPQCLTVDVSQPPRADVARLLAPYPNPFNPRTTIPFRLGSPQHVRLGIYRVDGREVALLLDAMHPAGGGEVPWNGTDAAGRPVASGVYFVRLVVPGYAAARRLVLVE